jgi:hypothetical protein
MWDPETAPGLGLSYGYRINKFIEPEAGVFATLQPAPDIQGAHYYLNPNDRFVWITWGVRFIAPLYLDRIEFSAGGGGLHENYSVSNHNTYPSPQPYSAWGRVLRGLGLGCSRPRQALLAGRHAPAVSREPDGRPRPLVPDRGRIQREIRTPLVRRA